MKPFYVLIGVFALAWLGLRLAGAADAVVWAGNAAMAAMLCFTAIGHFAFSQGMARMIPDFVPGKVAVVYLTGLLEIGLGICLLVPAVREAAAWATIAFFVLIIPANIQAALRHLNYETGTYDGPGPGYLWLRLPLQGVFIAWVWAFGLWLR